MSLPIRRIVATVLVVLASLLAFLAIFAIWLNRQALNTDNWTRTSSALLERPVIRDQLAARLTDELYRGVDVESAVGGLLPPRAQPLAGPAASALRDQVEKLSRKALERPAVQSLWTAANRSAHEQLLAVLEGGGSTVATANGTVVLDVKSLLAELQQRVGVGGRLSRALPASASRITIMKSDQLALAQDVAEVLKPLPVVLIVASLALLAVAIAIAPGWRRRAVRAYGIGFILAGAAALLGRSLVGDQVVESLTRTAAAQPAAEAVWSIATGMLVDVAWATIVYGVVLVFAAWVAGPTAWARDVRRAMAPYGRQPAIAYGTLTVVFAGLVWWAPTPAWRSPAMLLILLALLGAGVEALRRQLIREYPSANREEALARGRERVAAWRERQSGRRTPLTGSVTATPVVDDERIEQLERLGRLQQAGVLDAEEFRAEKDRILHRNGAERMAPD